jgi:hypothetical protein
VIVDRIEWKTGYLCAGCRKRQFFSYLGQTLVTGWWGLIALLFRNPFAIVSNVWALFAAPLGAGRLGAIHVDDLRASAPGRFVRPAEEVVEPA